MTRTQLIQSLIDKYELKSYLEIGVFNGANFNNIRCGEKHSVDPTYPATFEMTSDMFFDIQPDNAIDYDLIFIDGLHTEEQAYSDIFRSFGWLNDNGFIVVHDCNPATQWHTRKPEEYKQGEEWNGTTYRGFIRFKQEHPELTCFTVNTDYGCGVITRRPLLKNEVFTEDWEWFDSHRSELLQLISVEEFNRIK